MIDFSVVQVSLLHFLHCSRNTWTVQMTSPRATLKKSSRFLTSPRLGLKKPPLRSLSYWGSLDRARSERWVKILSQHYITFFILPNSRAFSWYLFVLIKKFRVLYDQNVDDCNLTHFLTRLFSGCQVHWQHWLLYDVQKFPKTAGLIFENWSLMYSYSWEFTTRKIPDLFCGSPSNPLLVMH